MRIEKQCTTIEQSRKLFIAECNEDIASMEWERIDGEWTLGVAYSKYNDWTIPCWTISDMMRLLYSYNRRFSINVLGQVELYSVDGKSKEIIGKEIKFNEDCTTLRDNLFEAIFQIKKTENL